MKKAMYLSFIAVLVSVSLVALTAHPAKAMESAQGTEETVFDLKGAAAKKAKDAERREEAKNNKNVH